MMTTKLDCSSTCAAPSAVSALYCFCSPPAFACCTWPKAPNRTLVNDRFIALHMMMNRSFTNVLFGAFGQVQQAKAGGEQKQYKSETAEGAAQVLEQSSFVVIIPGYGMAVAQAQHKVRELYDQLKKRGVTVKFAIHPVAGRMPGHMNVLLAEADIPYTDLVEMDEINPDMPQCDVALVVGANDVVNPAARSDKSSPIYGMPIIDADR